MDKGGASYEMVVVVVVGGGGDNGGGGGLNAILILGGRGIFSASV